MLAAYKFIIHLYVRDAPPLDHFSDIELEIKGTKKREFTSLILINFWFKETERQIIMNRFSQRNNVKEEKKTVAPKIMAPIC